MNVNKFKTEEYWSNTFSSKSISLLNKENNEYIFHCISETLIENGIKDFKYIEGFVLTYNSDIPVFHTWIEFENGDILDPVCRHQFNIDSDDIYRVSETESFMCDGYEVDFETRTLSAEEYSDIFC